MRVLPSALGATLVAAILALPADATTAEKIPTCFTRTSSTLCYYGVDLNDCFFENGQEYCRSAAFYEWSVAP